MSEDVFPPFLSWLRLWAWLGWVAEVGEGRIVLLIERRADGAERSVAIHTKLAGSAMFGDPGPWIDIVDHDA